jgi:hypothetical protein
MSAPSTPRQAIDVSDLSHSPTPIPAYLCDVRYDAARYPGALGVAGVEGGANCQQYAYAMLRHHGFILPDLRSSELWADTDHTAVVPAMATFDLVLLNRTPEAWGSHVGVCVGEDLILHLSKRIGVPAVESLTQMRQREEYCCLIGIKRVLRRA